MAKETIALEVALIAHRAKLDTIEALSKTTTEQMQMLLTLQLEAFDKTLKSWITAAPMHTFLSHYQAHYKQL